MHYDFKKDLKDGEDGEDEAQILLERLGYTNIISYKGQIAPQDRTCCKNGRKYHVEVKNDLMAQKTGNLAIEYMSRGKKSGIAITQADIWITLDKDVFYMLTVPELKYWLKVNWHHLSKVDGGDDKTSKLILVPKNKLSNLSFVEIYER